jgi:serine/threonine protein kinase
MPVRVEPHAEPIPGYRLIERLGGGGFGEVWKAEAPGGLQKAIKFVYGDLGGVGDNGQRAEQELKALKRVQSVRHPYVLSLERYDIIEGRLMIVMELADRNLWDRFKECRAQGLPGIPREELLNYLEETAEALDLMNQEYQLQHLDIKPQNIFLVHQHIKVADFGLVKDLEGSQASVTGGVTPVYAAPETFDGRVTRYSDQYSLGIVYQELLTGQRPFAATNVRQLILQHLQAPPNVSALPAADQPIILRSLSKVPEERFPTCRIMVRALRAVSPGKGSAKKEDRQPEPREPTDNEPGSGASLSSCLPLPMSSCLPEENEEGPATVSLRAPGGDGSAQGVTQFIRGADPSILRTGAPGAVETKPRRELPPEVTGTGTLFPSLVIGLGQMGLNVLQCLREQLTTHVAPARHLRHLRLLLCDTDPEIMRPATRGRPGYALTAGEVLLAPLNRPSYYLKPRDGRPNLESWLNPRMLYRIPRSQVTTGVRALGRLAFLDNYRSVVRRLQAELDTILEPDHLQTASRHTRLGIRTNRPRVYILTSLAGGSGSGMFIDLAYTLRALLRQMGYEQPDVVALLLLPDLDLKTAASRTRVMPLGNTYAALTELNHFADPAHTFRARYHEREAPIQDEGPPFSRCLMLPLPDETDEVATSELVQLAGQFLAQDLTAPLGRASDLGRADVSSPPWESRGLYYQTFGMFNLTCPRRALREAASRKLCQRLVQRWMSKDAKPFREIVPDWVKEQWQRLELGTESFIARLQEGIAQALNRTPETAFDALLDSVKISSHGESNGTARNGSKPELRPIPPEQIASLLASFEELVGTPQDEKPDAPGSLVLILRQVAGRLAAEWGQKLAELPIHLIEDPSFRLAGAEEAIRQLVATLEQALQYLEPLARELAQKALEAHERLRLQAHPGRAAAGRKAMNPADVLELLRNYPRWRFRSLVLQQVTGAFLGLRGHLSDELREVNFCRVRMAELLRLLEEPPPDPAQSTWQGAANRPTGIGRKLFTSGCRDLNEAVEQFLSSMTPEHLFELDGKVQETIKAQFTALVHVCLTTANILKNVESALRQTASEFADGYLPPTSVAELFFEQNCEEPQAESEIMSLYDEAAPEMTADSRSPRSGPQVGELCVLATPPGEASDRFRESLERVLPEVNLTTTTSPDDILIYRERLNLSLVELTQLGPLGRDAYAQMTATDHFTPHTRIDVEFRGE